MHLHTEASIRLNPKFSIKKAPFLWRLGFREEFLFLEIYVTGDTVSAATETVFEIFAAILSLHLLLMIFGSPSTPALTIGYLTYVGKVFEGNCEVPKFYSVLVKHMDKGLTTLQRAWETDLSVALTDQESTEY